jgi:hypothetical protein
MIDWPLPQVRERDWANVITGHEGEAAAFVWRLQAAALGEHELRPPEGAKEDSLAGRFRVGAALGGCRAACMHNEYDVLRCWPPSSAARHTHCAC